MECDDSKQVAVAADQPCEYCGIAQIPNNEKTACEDCPLGTIRDASGLLCLNILDCPPSSQAWLVDLEDSPPYQVNFHAATVNDDFEAGVNFSIMASPPRGTPLPLESTTITYTASSTNEAVPSDILDTCETTIRVVPGAAVVVETLGLLRTSSKHREIFAAGSSLAGNRVLLPRLPSEILSQPLYALTFQAPPNLEFIINLDQVPGSSARLVVSITYCTLGFEATDPEMYRDADYVFDMRYATEASLLAPSDYIAESNIARMVVDPLRGVCMKLDAATDYVVAANLEEIFAFYQFVITVRQVENSTGIPTSFGDLYPLASSSVYLEVERESCPNVAAADNMAARTAPLSGCCVLCDRREALSALPDKLNAPFFLNPTAI